MASLSVDAPSGDSNVAQQKLHHGSRVDELDGVAVLGPAQGIKNRSSPIGTACGADDLGRAFEFFDGAAADFSHFLGRVPLVVLLQKLEDTAGMLQARVGTGVTAGVEFIAPG